MQGTTRQSADTYRPDIQGLRAIAVLLVVCCHSGLAFSGGFVGVDVFFVISGFVIGALLLRELESSGSISFGRFYARRARRLLPSLAIVTVVTVIAGVLLLNPYLSQERSFKTAGAGTVFVANAYLYRHLGYFDAGADGRNPFLHLWSLSVEEQFYLVLPALVLAAWLLGRRRSPGLGRRSIGLVVAGASLVSLWLSWAMTSGHSPIPLQAPVRFAFYASPTRFWEFGVGVLLALGAVHFQRVPPALATLLGVIGAAAVFGASVLLDSTSVFPGVNAIPPVAGTGLLVVAGVRSAPIQRVLSVAPLRRIGDRSYTWYLWHWPAIVFAMLEWPGSRLAPVVAAAASLGVAAVVYRFVEDPIRRDRNLIGAKALRLAAVCVIVPGVLAFGAYRGTLGGWGVDEPTGWADVPFGRFDELCTIVNRDKPNDWSAEACTVQPPGDDPDGTVLVLGDMSANSAVSGVIEAAYARNLAVAYWGRAGCPLLAASPAGYPACKAWQEDALDLVDQLDPAAIVIANRASRYTTQVDSDDPWGRDCIRTPAGERTASEHQALDAWEEGLSLVLDQLGSDGVPAVVLGDVPGYPDSFPRERLSVLRPSTLPPTRSTAEVRDEQRPVEAVERAAVERAGRAAYVDPLPTFCDDECRTYRNGSWLYYGADDLTVAGGELLSPAIGRALDEVATPG